MALLRVREITSALLGLLLLDRADANGINPPRPSGGSTTEAACTQRANGKTVRVQRARIAVTEAKGSLELRIASEARPATLQLSQLARLRLASAKAGKDGFAAAELSLREPAYEGPGFVRLVVEGKPVRLTGFGADLARVEMPLANCKELVFQAPAPPERPASASYAAPKK
ncbi:MAG: hypothetical protein HY021_16290 [Burkholderiales bacterium]|nr:hypothetical protein [Burkholderiales bacterium]